MTEKQKKLVENYIRKQIRKRLNEESNYNPNFSILSPILGIKTNSELVEKKVRNQTLTKNDINVYIDFIEKQLKQIKNNFN